jgi:hypothetical protein
LYHTLLVQFYIPLNLWKHYAGFFIYTGERDITPVRSSKKRRRLLRLPRIVYDNLKIIVRNVPEILVRLRDERS